VVASFFFFLIKGRDGLGCYSSEVHLAAKFNSLSSKSSGAEFLLNKSVHRCRPIFSVK